jgi:hypothetical protein
MIYSHYYHYVIIYRVNTLWNIGLGSHQNMADFRNNRDYSAAITWISRQATQDGLLSVSIRT